MTGQVRAVRRALRAADAVRRYSLPDHLEPVPVDLEAAHLVHLVDSLPDDLEHLVVDLLVDLAHLVDAVRALDAADGLEVDLDHGGLEVIVGLVKRAAVHYEAEVLEALE